MPFYTVIPANLSTEARNGSREYTTREGYHQRFWGFEASATKRLANRWMARFGFSTNDHREYFDNRNTAIQDPTPSAGSPNVNGGLVQVQSTGSGQSGIYMVLPKDQFIATELYQAPWGFDIGFNANMRHVHSQPRSNVTTGDFFEPGSPYFW